MSIEVLNHIELAQSRPTSSLYEAVNFQKLIKVLINQAQEIEDALLLLAKQKDLSTVEGVWLDYIGKIVGENRKGRSDSAYRKALRLRIGVNSSDGTPDTISELVKLYTEADKITLVEGRWAWGQLIVSNPPSMDYESYLLKESLKPAATRLYLLSNISGTAFLPAWETQASSVELFEVFLGGLTETLELVVDSVGSKSPLYVNLRGEDYSYFEGTEGNNSFNWEVSEIFNVYDGTNTHPLELQIDFATRENLELQGVKGGTEGEVTWCWEVDQDHTGTVINTGSVEDLEAITSRIYNYANYQLPQDLILI